MGDQNVFPQNEDEDDDLPLFFRLSEMKRLLPPDVIEDMMADPVTRRSNKYLQGTPGRRRSWRSALPA